MHRPMFSLLSVSDRPVGLKPIPSIGTPTATAPVPCPECEATNGPMSGDAITSPRGRLCEDVAGRNHHGGRGRRPRWLRSPVLSLRRSAHEASIWVSKSRTRIAPQRNITPSTVHPRCLIPRTRGTASVQSAHPRSSHVFPSE